MNKEITFNVRSKECTQIGSLNTNLLVYLPISIVIPDHSQCEMSCVSAEIPLSFYNISSALQNNLFQYYVNINPSLQSFTIPDGNYTVDTLMVVINSFSTLHFVMTYDDTYNKFFITLTPIISDFIILYDGDKYWQQIYGVFNNQLILYPSGYLNGVVNLASVHSLQIRVGLNTGSTISTSNSNSDVIQKIPLQTNANGIIIHNSNNYIQKSYIKSGTIKSFYLNITEQNQKLIDLNGCVYELTFLFKIISDESHITQEQKIYRSKRLSGIIENTSTFPVSPIVESAIEPTIESAIEPTIESAIEPVQEITLSDIANELLSI